MAVKKRWLSGEHFSVDGTLIQAWASNRSFMRKDKDDDDTPPDQPGNFKGERRSNDTHESKTASELRYMGHTLSDNRHGLIANAVVTVANGFAEREAAKAMINDARQALGDPDNSITLGADNGCDTAEFIRACDEMKVIPHVMQNKSGRRSAVPESVAQTPGYAQSQKKRKLIEQGFAWAKTVGSMRQVMVRGLQRMEQMFVLTMAAYNLVRMRTLGQIRLRGAN